MDVVPLVVGDFQGGHGKANLLLGAVQKLPTPAGTKIEKKRGPQEGQPANGWLKNRYRAEQVCATTAGDVQGNGKSNLCPTQFSAILMGGVRGGGGGGGQ